MPFLASHAGLTRNADSNDAPDVASGGILPCDHGRIAAPRVAYVRIVKQPEVSRGHYQLRRLTDLPPLTATGS